MAFEVVNTVKTNMGNQIAAAVDAGVAGGKLKLMDGTRPALGGAETNVLAECTFSTTAFVSNVNGVLTADTITGDATPVTGTATWARVTDSDNNAVIDMDIADVNLPSNEINSGIPVEIDSFVYTVNT